MHERMSFLADIPDAQIQIGSEARLGILKFFMSNQVTQMKSILLTVVEQNS